MEESIIVLDSRKSVDPVICVDDISSIFEGDYNIIMRDNSFSQPRRQ